MVGEQTNRKFALGPFSRMADVVLHREIDRFRERLLDLSLRNPLLSYRKSKRRTLQVVDQLPNVIYDRLVEAGKPFTLDWVPDPPERNARDNADVRTPAIVTGGHSGTRDQGTFSGAVSEIGQAAATGPRSNEPVEQTSEGLLQYPISLPEHDSDLRRRYARSADDRLQTNLTKEKLDSLLRYMQREAETAMQETGINYLFLALGFLTWRESGSSEKDRLAPLLLIPIRIERVAKANGEARFTIQWDEDDVQSNLSLQKKLSRDFDLSLPEFQTDSNPEAYFREVGSTIQSQPAWSVFREAVLGFFSFHKLSMYADINPVNWNLEDGAAAGSIVERLICGAATTDSEPYQAEAGLYAKDYDIDHNPTVSELVLSMDADSSQQSALVDIRNGRNLVIEGPPGTGKSQTITNAIADAIGAGRTVLFVAEKLAALEVVHDRLASLGLDDFCLELHSDAASPRQVFASFQKRLTANYESPRDLR